MSTAPPHSALGAPIIRHLHLFAPGPGAFSLNFSHSRHVHQPGPYQDGPSCLVRLAWSRAAATYHKSNTTTDRRPTVSQSS